MDGVESGMRPPGQGGKQRSKPAGKPAQMEEFKTSRENLTKLSGKITPA
jgi:hypothetical protein